MSIRDDWERRAAAHRPERRQSLGDQIGNAFLSYAQTPQATARQTAAVELAAGMLGRVLATAKVEGVTGITPVWLRNAGRDIVNRGEHLSRIAVRDGQVRLIRQSAWSWHGEDADPWGWTARSTETGPSSSKTREITYEGLVHLDWSSSPHIPYIGQAAAVTAKLSADTAANTELSMGREAGGDVARIIPAPEGTEGDDSTSDADNDDNQHDPHAGYRKDLASARGGTMLVESMANNHDMGGKAPDDWQPRRLGPAPPAGFVDATEQAHHRLLGALGVPVGLATDADGTSQREGLRRWWLTVVDPVVCMLEHELSMKLERPITLELDRYAWDMVSRATVVAKLVQAGATVEMALTIAGIEP